MKRTNMYILLLVVVLQQARPEDSLIMKTSKKLLFCSFWCIAISFNSPSHFTFLSCRTHFSSTGWVQGSHCFWRRDPYSSYHPGQTLAQLSRWRPGHDCPHGSSWECPWHPQKVLLNSEPCDSQSWEFIRLACPLAEKRKHVNYVCVKKYSRNNWERASETNPFSLVCLRSSWLQMIIVFYLGTIN